MRLGIDLARHSLRTLARNKRFSALAILSLAIAIALNTTMYSVLDAMINPKLAMRDPDRLFTLRFYGDYRGHVADQVKLDALNSLSLYDGIARRVGVFGNNIVERGALSRHARVVNVSANFFTLAGNVPTAGRLLSEADLHSAPRPVVMGERLWKQLFPERTSFDTATINLDGEPRPVVGLLPYEADFPGSFTDIWQLAPPSTTTFFGGYYAGYLVRLRSGISVQEAEGELGALAHRLALLADGPRGDARFVLKPAIGEPFRFQRFHWALIAAVLAVLLVACVNLANLQLARGITRSRELATRAAIGASRADIIAQLMLETAWLAAAGLVIGMLLTVWGMKVATTAIPPSLEDYLWRPQTSWRVFAFATVATLSSLVIMGLVPAIRLSRVDINELLKSGAGTGSSRRTRRQYGALVVVQISLALALLVGATLLLRTASELNRLKLGANLERIVQGWLRVTPRNAADRRRMADLSAEVVARARALPTVADAATLTGAFPKNHKITLDDPGGAQVEIGTGMFTYSVVSSSYLRTLGLEITKGRDFQEGEFAERLVIVDEHTAAYLWPGANPIGRMIKLSDAVTSADWLRVIGVVRFVNYWSVLDRSNQESRRAPRLGAIYVLNGADTSSLGKKAIGLQFVVRGTTNLERLPLLLQNGLSDPGLGLRTMYVARLQSMLRLDKLRERQNFVAAIFVTFAVLALAVAALGVYAIVSHTVSQRTREFGVRMALGAGEHDIRQSVLFEGNVLALTGIAVGLIVAARTVGLLQAFLGSEDDVYDSWLFALVALVLFAITLVASYVPARRAMRINPVEALRND